MKNILLLLLACTWAVCAKAQPSCNASMTWSQSAGSLSANFSNTSTYSNASSQVYVGLSIYIRDANNNFLGLVNGAGGYFQFPAPGTYNVCASIYVNDQAAQLTCDDSTCYSVTIVPPPCYSIISSVTGTGNTRTFAASTPANTPGMTYSWNWGDGTPAGSGATASHTYSSIGSYGVTLTATGSGCIDTATTVVHITTPLNCSTLTTSFSAASNGIYVQAFPTSTTLSVGAVTHSWDWGDGTTSTSVNNFATYHQYAASGTYTVTLTTVWSQNGVTCAQTSSQSVTFTMPPCSVAFTSSGTGQTRTYTATNLANTPGLVYNWFFGDGTTGTGNPVTHTFAYGGQYLVALEATSVANNCSDSATSYDTVAGPFNCPSATNSIYVPNTTSMTKSFSAYAYVNQTGGYTPTHSWDFGNGASATGNPVVYTYPTAGTYTVRLITNWYAANSSTIVCADTSYQSVTAGVAGFNCATATSSFTGSGQSTYWAFIPAITPGNFMGVTVSNQWSFGDGTTGTTLGSSSTWHNYSSTGTYNVCLVTRWLQSGTTNVLCADTSCQTITVTVPNVISGYVRKDSTPISVDTFQVYLITFDPTTNMLQAIDSTIAVGNAFAYYQFLNKPAGMYRIKAAKLNGPFSGPGYVPTYGDSSLTWNGTNVSILAHTGGGTFSMVYMRQGTVTSGLGFVGGSVLQGANKGTADGDPVANQLVFLREATTSKLVQSAYTNSAGQYSFANIPVGSYSVYPEEMNYATTPSSTVTISASNTSLNGIAFKKDDVDRTIMPASATGISTVASAAPVFTIAPNPNNGRVELTLATTRAQEAAIRVTTLTGQVVYTGRVATPRPMSLDLTYLQSGVYFVTVSTDAGTSSAKLVITH